MNKTEFLKALEKQLKYLPKEDRDDALNYYSEYIDDMNFAENEDISIRLGKPKDIAKNIISECAEKTIDKHDSEKGPKSTAKIVWLTILIICSSPVTLPIAIALLTIVFTLVLTITVVLLSLGLSAVLVLLAGIICTVLSFILPGFGTKLVGLGIGLIIAAVGALLLIITIFLAELFIKLIILICKAIIGKKKEA